MPEPQDLKVSSQEWSIQAALIQQEIINTTKFFVEEQRRTIYI